MHTPTGAVVVGFPLGGEGVAVRTPAHRIPSHGTDRFGQRYAFDFVRPDDRKGPHLQPAGTLASSLLDGRTRDYYGWGQHAAFDGQCRGGRGPAPERASVQVVRELAVALKTMVRFDPARVSRSGDWQPCDRAGSPSLCAVRASGSGHRVGRHGPGGSGRVGRTGNSTAPHLHFQLMDSPDPVQAKGVPSAFEEYLVQRDGTWERVERGIHGRRERIRCVLEGPLQAIAEVWRKR